LTADVAAGSDKEIDAAEIDGELLRVLAEPVALYRNRAIDVLAEHGATWPGSSPPHRRPQPVVPRGLDGLTPQELRHTAASLAVSAGANIKAVQRLLGHASAAMTLDVYSCLFGDDLGAVADRLDAARAPLAPSVRHKAIVIGLGSGGQAADLENVEPPRGIEPRTYALRVRRSDRLS
jgi:hypothetical protein